ncbi:MAG: dihydrolipoamide acetyltransferase [Myxococcota bacterium]
MVALLAAIAAAPLAWSVARAQVPEEPPASAAVAPVSQPDEQAAEDAQQAEADFARELRTVEEDVSSLKERVFRSKATLKLLKELVVDPAISGSRLVIWHVNKLGGGYTMESAQYFLDGKSVFNKLDSTGALDAVTEVKVAEQTVPAGPHTLQVNLVLRGKGYKVFSYLRSYQFKVTSSYPFKVEEGRVSVIRVLADSRGGLRNFVDRPTIRYDERTESFRED